MFEYTRTERVANIIAIISGIIIIIIGIYIGVNKYQEYKNTKDDLKQKVESISEENQDVEIINAYLGFKDGESKIVKLEGNAYLVTSKGKQIKVKLDDSKVTILEES